MYTGAHPSHLIVNDNPPGITEGVPATVPVVQAPVVNDNPPDNIEEVPATVPVVEPPVNPEKTKSDSDKEALSERIKILESDSDNDALSKSIKILRNLLKAETGKKEYWEKKYREALGEKERLRKLLNQRNFRVNKIQNKTVTKAEKLKIVKEILSESNFTEAQCGIFTQNSFTHISKNETSIGLLSINLGLSILAKLNLLL